MMGNISDLEGNRNGQSYHTEGSMLTRRALQVTENKGWSSGSALRMSLKPSLKQRCLSWDVTEAWEFSRWEGLTGMFQTGTTLKTRHSIKLDDSIWLKLSFCKVTRKWAKHWEPEFTSCIFYIKCPCYYSLYIFLCGSSGHEQHLWCNCGYIWG